VNNIGRYIMYKMGVVSNGETTYVTDSGGKVRVYNSIAEAVREAHEMRIAADELRFELIRSDELSGEPPGSTAASD
jgi:hypothetical protein